MSEKTLRPTSRNTLAAFAYPLGAVGAVLCLWRGSGDAFVRFHAWQSILLTLILVVAVVALRAVPLVGPPLAVVVAGASAGLALFLAARAYRGHWTAVPLLGDVAIERIPPSVRP
jgi:uncharacterized membrane protein